MSGVAIIRYLLANNAALIAVVPATRIMAGALPLNTALPAISVQQSGMDERLNVAMSNAKVMQTERVIMSIKTATYPEQHTLLTLVEAACPHTRGAVNGFDVDSILPDATGPDLFLPEENIYLQDKSFTVRFNEST
jgi:hypothetical protein